MNGRDRFLPYGRQQIEDDDIEAVVRALQADYLTTGPGVDAFEAAFADYTGAAHAVAVANGTAALHLASMALDLGPGDCVIVPAVTFAATANAALYTGADVVFADVEAETGLMTPVALEEALRRTGGTTARAVYPVHLAGQCGDVDAIAAIAAEHGLAMVEDACHAIGGTYRDTYGEQPVGRPVSGGMATFSFHAVKTVTTCEGGMITTSDAATAERLRRLRSHGVTRDPDLFSLTDLATASDGGVNPWHYEIPELGYNYRLSDVQCALGLAQLAKLSRFVTHRARLVALYDELLAPLSPVVEPLGRTGNGAPAWHLYVALIDFAALGLDRAGVMARLREAGIGTQVHYMPVYHHPIYRARYGELRLPGAEAYFARALSLPLFAGMTDEDVARVAAELTRIVEAGAGGGA